MKILFHEKIKETLTTHKRRRPLFFLLLGILSLASLGSLIIMYPPSMQIAVLGLDIPLMPLFFILVFGTFYFLGAYAFKSTAHGFLLSTFISTYLLFRINELTHPFFFILLFALFLTLELFVSYRK